MKFIGTPVRTRTPAIEKALVALAFGQTANQPSYRIKRALEVYPNDKLVSAIIERAGAPVATTTGTGFAAELVQNLVGEYVATLAPLSAAAQIIAQGIQVNFGSAGAMNLPAREGAASTVVNWVGESDPIPVYQYTLNDDCELSPRKFGLIVGVSRETAKRANGQTVIQTLMREDAAASLDGAYFSADAGDTATHAGMLYNVDPLTGFAGGDQIAMETDLAALSDAVSAAGSGQLVFVTSPRRANRVKIRFPDIARELTFLPSLAVADTTVIALDPLSFAHGFSDDFEIDVTNAATIHMNTEPLEIVSSTGPTVADPVRSFWQTDAIAIRLLADVAFSTRRTNAVAWLQNATW